MTSRPAVRWGLAAAVALSAFACAPVPRTLSAGAPAGSPVIKSGVDWQSKDQNGELLLPTHVEVELRALRGSRAVSFTDASGGDHQVLPSGVGVSLDGRPAEVMARYPGPVRIQTGVGSDLHEGELMVERAPESGLAVAVRLPLETYIAGVVSAELPIWSARPAELEAQAIAARTFAAGAIAKRQGNRSVPRLSDTVLDQAYHGSYDGSASQGAKKVKERLNAAVAGTRGIVLVRGERLEEARYHASCGGHTASFADVFAKETAEFGARGPASRPCQPCRLRARREAEAKGSDKERPLSWVAELSHEKLVSLGAELELGGPLEAIRPARRDAAGRWLAAWVKGPGRERQLPFDAIRKAAGYGELKSAMVDTMLPRPGRAIEAGEPLFVQGRGRGHGVGLCQEGARDHAALGLSAGDILALYYPGTVQRRLESYPTTVSDAATGP